MSEICNVTHKPRRPATPPHSRWILRRSVRPRFAAAIWNRLRQAGGKGEMSETSGKRMTSETRGIRRTSRLVALVSLVALISLSGCASQPELVVLSGDRQIVREADGSYRVSEVWMQERYQLERALRLRLERCEAERTGSVAPTIWRAE